MRLSPMNLRARRRVTPFAFLLFTAVPACAAPLQNGGVEVHEGIEERFGFLCRFRHGTDGDSVCAAPETPALPARAQRIARDAELLRGRLAQGRVGDFLLENDQIAIVIDQIKKDDPLGESGGDLIDAAFIKSRRDELGRVTACVGAQRAVYTAIQAGKGAEGSAYVEARGHAPGDENLVITTRYVLFPGQRALVLSTVVDNRGAEPTAPLALGDCVDWAEASPFMPDELSDSAGVHRGAFVGATGLGLAYGLVNEDQSILDGSLFAERDASTSRVHYARPAPLGPGKSARYDRVLVLAPRPDPLALATEVFFLQGGTPGGLAVEFVDAQGASLPPPAEGRVLFEDARIYDPDPHLGRVASDNPAWRWIDARSASAVFEAPPGRYVIGFERQGQRSPGRALAVASPGKVSKVRLTLSVSADESPPQEQPGSAEK